MRRLRISRLHVAGLLLLCLLGGCFVTTRGAESANEPSDGELSDDEMADDESAADEANDTDEPAETEMAEDSLFAEPEEIELDVLDTAEEPTAATEEPVTEAAALEATGVDPLTGQIDDAITDTDEARAESVLERGDVVVAGDGNGIGTYVVVGDGEPNVFVTQDDGREDERAVEDLDGPQAFVEPDQGPTIMQDPQLSGAAPEPELEPQTMAEQANTAAAQAHLAEWIARNDVAGTRLAVSFPDNSIAFLMAGTEEDGSELVVDAPFLATSITKTMTAAIIFGLIDEGAIGLDDGAPVLDVYPEFAHAERVTIRQLLQHTSGIAPYQESEAWDPDVPLTPIDALRLSSDLPLESEPGSTRGYSNTGYLYLGLIAEQLAGTPFPELVGARIAGPVALEHTWIDETPRPGWSGSSAGGATSTLPDLVRWGSALYRDRSALQPEHVNAMLDVNNEHSTGLGANVICPCAAEGDRLTYRSIGHDGGSVTLQHSPSDNLVVAAKLTESFWTEDLRQTEVHDLLAELRTILAT